MNCKLIARPLALVISLMCAGFVTAGPLGKGDIAPNWVLLDEAGLPVSLYQQIDSGHPALMLFCATWCETCQKLLPAVERMDIPSRVGVFMMNVWETGDPKAFLAETAPSLPLMLQADAVARRFEIGVTPGVVVVGPDHRILYKPGPNTGVETIERELQAVLSQFE